MRLAGSTVFWVSQFKILGNMLDHYGSFAPAIKRQFDLGSRAAGLTLRALNGVGGLPHPNTMPIFDSFSRSVTLYGSQLWAAPANILTGADKVSWTFSDALAVAARCAPFLVHIGTAPLENP